MHRFRWVKAPTSSELNQLSHTIAHRLARYLERRGLLNGMSSMALWHWITQMKIQWINCGGTPLPIASRWVFSGAARSSPKAPAVGTLQTLPGIEESFGKGAGQSAGFSLHGGVAAAAQQRDKLERLCRYIALQGCRVLRRLGTIASAPDRPYLKNACH